MSTIPTVNIAILGASGYTGAELIRLLHTHPGVSIAALTGDSQAGKPIGEVYAHLAHLELPDLVTIEQVDWPAIGAVFCCLPHGTTQAVIAQLPAHLKIIDLSADFRLHDLDTYAQWYGHAHQAAALQKEAVYGLTEHARAQVAKARLVANPGCYPTSAQLPLIPLLKAGQIEADAIVIDAKSGVTGAGRGAKQTNLFAEIDGGISAYGIGAHRHTPEIEQGLSQAAGRPVQVRFTPHLVPMARGILSTIYVTLAGGAQAGDLRATLQQAYGRERFVQVLPQGKAPSTHQVRGTNDCAIGVFADRVAGRAILVSAIDNLVKGAAGQAVQNFNVMTGWPEATGLELVAVVP
jgi:N-acetyl-gamma-glutamyl-phosphate reductase